jgi:hypothetical protein
MKKGLQDEFVIMDEYLTNTEDNYVDKKVSSLLQTNRYLHTFFLLVYLLS